MEKASSQPEAVGAQRGNSRRGGRVRVHMIGSSLGELRDLSAVGARVSCRRRCPAPGASMALRIDGLDGTIDVRARVVWRERVGWFRYELGLEFLKPDAAARAALATLARTAPLNQTFGLYNNRRRSA